MRIAFYANHDKTYFFYAVAKELERHGHVAYWISPGRRLADWLRAKGVPRDRVLDLTTLAPAWRRPGGQLPRLPRPLPGPMQLNAMIRADRFLREQPPQLARRYLAVSGSRIVEFAAEHQIEVLLGEQTYGLELLAGALLLEKAIPFLVPATVRIPSLRFALFQAPFQAAFATDAPITDGDRDLGRRTLAEFLDRPSKPYYFAGNQGWLVPDVSWLVSPFKQLVLARQDPDELNRPGLRWLLKSRLRQVALGQAARAYPFSKPSVLADRPYVLFTLHRQPEASLDVLGFRFADQLEVIRAITQDMPDGWMLAVKEHSNGLGDRSPSFYRQARRLPGVVLVDPWADSLELARGARLVLTISGTVAYEAALAGLPAATLVPMYFGPTLLVSGLNPYSGQLEDLLRRLANGEAETKSLDERAEFMACVIANSAPGLIGAPSDTPECMTPDNIGAVATGLVRLLAHYRAARPDAT